MRTYSYTGPDDLLKAARSNIVRGVIRSPSDLLSWVERASQHLDSSGMVTATFVVIPGEGLTISDRHSEHVACARGRDVLSAGEVTIEMPAGGPRIDSITNQSTGYCPEPESWPAVYEAIELAGLEAPDGFEPTFVFRKCTGCGAVNIVKEGVFECAVCETELSREWNIGNVT